MAWQFTPETSMTDTLTLSQQAVTIGSDIYLFHGGDTPVRYRNGAWAYIAFFFFAQGEYFQVEVDGVGHILLMGAASGRYTPDTDTWEEDLGNWAAARQWFGSCVDRDGITYAIGGYDGAESANTVSFQSLAVGASSWVSLTDVPAALQYVTAVYDPFNHLIYVAGGINASSAVVATFYRYDIDAGTWTTLTSMPAVRFGGTMGVDRAGRVYYFSGKPLGVLGGMLSTVWRYTPSAGTWATLASIPQSLTATVEQGSEGVADKTFLVGDRLYFPAADAGGSAVTYAVAYDTIQDSWSISEPASEAHNRGGWTFALNKFWLIAGSNGGPTTTTVESIGGNTLTEIPFLVANDRYQTVAVARQGATTNTPHFRYWYANAPSWDAELAQDALYPPYHSQDELGATPTGSVELPFLEVKPNQEVIVDGVLVEYIPRPSALTDTATGNLGFTCRVEGIGPPNYERSNAGAISGIAVSDSFTVAESVTTQDDDAWPNVRTAFLPIRLNQHVRAVRVVLTSVKMCEISRVQVLGKPVAGRTV